MKKWKTLSTKVVKKNPWWEYRLDEFETPAGVRGKYHYMHTTGSSFVVAVRKDGKIAWLEQYRYLLNDSDLELPGGGLKPSQSHREAALAELLEETGLVPRLIKKIDSYWSNSGLSDETAEVFLASGLEQHAASPEDTEALSLRWLTLQQTDRAVSAGRVKDSLSLSGWTLARPHVLKLIDQMKKKR